jgi:hypothetical protein
MLQLILHGIGDYFLQTDWQALNKKKPGRMGLWACLKHCLTYSIPFLLIASPLAVSVIFVTHFIIDRTHLVDYALAWKNGVYKWSPNLVYEEDVEAGTFEAKKILNIDNFGFGMERPFPITIWLYIICDNLCHIICNYLVIKYL